MTCTSSLPWTSTLSTAVLPKSQLGNICASGSFADGENEKDGSWSDYDLDDVDVEALRSDLGLESDSETLRHAMYEPGSESGDFDLYEF